METKAGETLAWQAVIAANEAHTELASAKESQAKLREVAALGLNGVTIEADAAKLASARVQTANREFTNILEVTKVLGVKKNNPNPSVAESAPHKIEMDDELANELREQGAIEWREIEEKEIPVITNEGFSLIACSIFNNKGVDVKPLASRAFNAILSFRHYSENFEHELSLTSNEGYGNGFFNARAITELAKTLQANHRSYMLRNFGKKSSELLSAVASFVDNNSEVLFAKDKN